MSFNSNYQCQQYYNVGVEDPPPLMLFEVMTSAPAIVLALAPCRPQGGVNYYCDVRKTFRRLITISESFTAPVCRAICSSVIRSLQIPSTRATLCGKFLAANHFRFLALGLPCIKGVFFC